MKQDLALPDLIFTVLAAVLCVVAVLLAQAGTSASAKPAAEEIRYIEPVTAIGPPDALAGESLAGAKQDETGVPLQCKDGR